MVEFGSTQVKLTKEKQSLKDKTITLENELVKSEQESENLALQLQSTSASNKQLKRQLKDLEAANINIDRDLEFLGDMVVDQKHKNLDYTMEIRESHETIQELENKLQEF